MGGGNGRSSNRRSRRLLDGRNRSRRLGGFHRRCGDHLVGDRRRWCVRFRRNDWRFNDRRCCHGRSFLGRHLLDRLRLLGLLITDQPIALGLAADTVRLGVDDARRMRLYPDAQFQAQVQTLLVGQSKLFRKLVDSEFRCQVAISVFLSRTREPQRLRDMSSSHVRDQLHERDAGICE